MPEIEGMALARLLRRFGDPPAVVFLTGHPSPPWRPSRSSAWTSWSSRSSRSGCGVALERVARRRAPARAGGAAANGRGRRPTSSRSTAPGGGAKRLVRVDTISLVQASGDYARIVCDDGEFLLRTPLARLENEWEPRGFARVHRGYLVNLRARRRAAVRAQRDGGALCSTTAPRFRSPGGTWRRCGGGCTSDPAPPARETT